MAVLFGQAARGLPLYDSARPFAALATLAALYTLLAVLRLRAIATSTSPTAPQAEPAVAPVPPRGVGGAFVAEWRRVLGIRGAFMLLVLAPWVYGLYYPQPFLNQILRKIPIAVVDSDLSELSRNIVQTLDASGAVRVAVQAETLAAARAALDRGDAFAVVGIPPETERDVLKGNTAHIPIYADATYLFIFRSMASGIAVAIDTLSSELAAGGARTDGSLVKAALASRTPAEVLLQPIFNPVGGYASFIVPAAFVLLLQQMLLIGASMLTVVALTQPRGGAFATVLGRGIAHLTIYLPALALYFIVLPRVYGFSTLGHPLQLFALASLFALATCPFRKSYPDVMVVQAGQDWDGDNGAGPLDCPTQRRVFTQGQVRTDLIVIRRIRRKNLPQMRFAKDQHPVQALATHGANQTLHVRILPRRSRRDRSVADAHRPHA